MIIINDLKKYYKNNLVLDINYFRFEKGKTYLLLGSNGSGKSTLVKSIIGLINYQGEIIKNSKYIGYVPERFPEISLIKAKTLFDNLTLEKQKTIREEIIGQFSNFFDLNINKKICSLSKGNMQKVMIIQALINNADVFIFDEAMNGLDKLNQKKLIEIIKILKKSNKTIIITSHYPDFYNECYDYIITMSKGKIYEIKKRY